MWKLLRRIVSAIASSPDGGFAVTELFISLVGFAALILAIGELGRARWRSLGAWALALLALAFSLRLLAEALAVNAGR